ncbi:hypothetical protein JCM16303_000084 [Sporobolomyces ruberrimus]
MRPSLRFLIKPVPISSIPPNSLRLPSKPAPVPNLRETSPTITKLFSKLSSASRQQSAGEGREDLPSDGRGLGGFKMPTRRRDVPSNLRVEEYVPKRTEFQGVGKKHRDLLRRLRREA